MMVTVTITSHSFATAAAAHDGEGSDAACSRIQGPVSSLVEQRWRLVYLHVERIFVQLGPKEEPPPPQGLDQRHRGYEPYVGVLGGIRRSGYDGVRVGAVR
jgi:hypothetical protein